MTEKKTLKYIHITKTSGSYIEELGKKKIIIGVYTTNV